MDEQNNTNLGTTETVENIDTVNAAVTEDVVPTKESKKLNAKKWTIIGTIVSVVIALAFGIGIYNTPENRLSRQLDLGQKYLEEQNYEEAVLAFDEAIAIDDKCLEAYVGGIEAYLQLGNSEEFLAFYDRALVAAESLEGEVLANNLDYICSIYLYADDVNDNTAKVIEILEKGLVLTGDNAEIKKELVDNYLIQAKDYVSKDAFVDGLKAYDRLLELDARNKQLIDDLSACLNEYIEVLISAKNYDEIRKLADKYGSYGLNVDFDTILARVAELERIDAEILAFMEKLYSLMSTEDYVALCELVGLDETKKFLERIEDEDFEEYVYIPEDESCTNGLGVGVYRVRYLFPSSEEVYFEYFYFGNYVNGMRNGIGNYIAAGENGAYVILEVNWNNNEPNGYSEQRSINEDGSIRFITKGNVINGLYDGKIEEIFYDGERTFDFLYECNNGIPTVDRTQEYFAAGGGASIDVEEVYVFAYDFDGYADAVMSIEYGYRLGVISYGQFAVR